MDEVLNKALVLIQSSEKNCKNFGTGFVIHRDEQADYVLTCAHVVRDVGGSDRKKVIADRIPAQVIAEGDDGFDLAVLKVERLKNKRQLKLRVSEEKEKRFIVAGHHKLQGANHIQKEEITGKISGIITIVSSEQADDTKGWNLIIDDNDDNYYLEKGYSGSPVVDEISGEVLGVTFLQRENGKKGQAISIEALPKIWQEMPPQLLLPSEKGIDYTKLRDLLTQGKWKEADKETLLVMLKVAGREEEGWLRVSDIEKFPCTDLRTIDSLWVKYSKGRFGFSVQKRIWESVGGTPNADYETYERFCDRVEWRVHNNWINYSDFTFTTEAPWGHLPLGWLGADGLGWRCFRSGSGSVRGGAGVAGVGRARGCGILFSRVETCKL